MVIIAAEGKSAVLDGSCVSICTKVFSDRALIVVLLVQTAIATQATIVSIECRN